MKTIIYKITFSVVFLFSLVTLKSQAQQVKIFNTKNSELPNNEITTMAIDARGNKWFGTYSGEVVKFDDTNWTVYNKSNSKLTGNLIKSIAIDAQDNLWIGTSDFGAKSHGELLKFDNTNWTIYNSSNSGLPYAGITDIAIDALGNKWISTSGGGVAKFDDTKWTVYNRANSSLSLDYIDFIEIDNLGNKWLYAGMNLFKFYENRWTSVNIPEFETAWSYYGSVHSFVIDAEGNKWMGTMEDSDLHGGLIEFDDKTWSYYNNNNISVLPRQFVMSIAIDAQGNKWLGMSDWWNNEALVKFDGINWTVYNSANSGLPDMFIRSMGIDKKGKIWLGTFGSGVVEFNENGIAGFNENGITTGLTDNISVSSDDFTVYPNPATKFMILSVENFYRENLSFQLIDIHGRVLNTQKIADAQTRIPMENLSPTIYGLQVMTNGKVINTFKIVKN